LKVQHRFPLLRFAKCNKARRYWLAL
jgi:hypothetical protein